MIIEGSDFVHPKEGMRTLLTFNCFFPYGLEVNNNNNNLNNHSDLLGSLLHGGREN